MRILLIDPPFYRFIGYYNRFFPLGLASLAAILREAGHEVLIYDADCNREATKMEFSRLEDSYPEYIRGINDSNHKLWQETRDMLKSFQPDLVGITMMTTKAASAFRLAEICKSFNPNLTVVVGGPHPTLMPEEVLKNCIAIDIALRGEGEIAFRKLVEALATRQPLDSIPSISFRENGVIKQNTLCEIIEDLDTLPLPAR
ncbi:MAG: cobalamin-dependent protein, partial [Parcubacteria group bacterium]